MNIETKHNIDDEVWIINKDTQKIESRRVDKITLSVFSDRINVWYELDFRLPHNPNRNVVPYSEDICFSSKQALIESL